MSHPGYPFQQGSASNSGHTHQPRPPNWGPPYPQNSTPYPSQNGVFAPSLGFNVGSPMYMPQPYAGSGYPLSSSGASYVPPNPQSSPYRSSQSQTYPNPQSSYPNSQSSYPNSQTSYPYLQTSYPNPQPSCPNPQPSCPNSQSSYPNSQSSYPNVPASNYSHNQSPAYPQSSYPNKPVQSYPSASPYPSIHGHSYSDNHGYLASGHTHASRVIKRSPTVVPIGNFNPRQDAEVLRKAMKGFGTDEKTIINVLTKRSNAQRLEIALQFKSLYGKDLIKELKSELSGNFEKVIVALMTPLPQYYAKELHDAISGLGTDETVLIEVLCSLSNAEIRTIREAYQTTYKKNLESDIKGDTSGHFRRLMVSLCNAGRDESGVTNPTAAAADAQALYNAGEKRWGTDESTFNMVLCQRNHDQLRLVFQEYQKISNHDLEKVIKSEFSGDIQNGLLAVIRSIKNQQAFFAERLYKSMKGLGTNDRDLIRLIVTRCEIDMGEIKRVYIVNHNESLGDAIKGDTSGDYKKCLLALIGEA